MTPNTVSLSLWEFAYDIFVWILTEFWEETMSTKSKNFLLSLNLSYRKIWTGVVHNSQPTFLDTSRAARGVWGNLDSLFATFHSRVIGNGKYWSDGWGEKAQIAHLIATHSRRFGPDRSGSLYCNSDDVPDIQWKSGAKKKLGQAAVNIWEGEFASPVQVRNHSRPVSWIN